MSSYHDCSKFSISQAKLKLNSTPTYTNHHISNKLIMIFIKALGTIINYFSFYTEMENVHYLENTILNTTKIFILTK